MSKIPGIRRIRTPFKEAPGERSKQTRIRIPQPVEHPFHIRSRDLVQQEYLRKSPYWDVLHKRGLTRPLIGTDALEDRAVPKGMVRGSLPERIIYKYLTDKMHFQSNVDFDFQSSLQGGRLELGGMVADFLFEIMKIIINVQGPTHKGYLRGRKDEEQRNILDSMGYTVYELWEDTIYNEYKLDDEMRRIFWLGESSGSGYELSEAQSIPQEDLLGILAQTENLITLAGFI